MQNNEQIMELLGILRGIVSIQSRHNEAISGIHRSYSDLLNALAGKAGTEDPPRTAATDEALGRAQIEIRELERMFGTGDAGDGGVA